MHRWFIPYFLLFTIVWTGCRPVQSLPESTQLRVATFNVEDIRTVDLLNDDQPRVKKIVDEIAELRPDIILINEIQYDGAGDPWSIDDQSYGMNGRRLLDALNREGVDGVTYDVFMAPSNTGISSGFDLDNDGLVTTAVPEIPDGTPDGSAGPQTREGRAYGNDSFGFGMFPGQYAMAVLVNSRFSIQRDSIRTFQNFLWKDLPDPMIPFDPESGTLWYSEDEWAAFRLSSKSHWDIPIALGNGKTLHLLASHPTPPAFDGPENRNKFRNHDEIRFWSEYLSDAAFIIDDRGRSGGLPHGVSFVIVGDLNADINEGSSIDNPVKKYLIENQRVNGSFVPQGDREIDELDSDDTAWWGLRIDYVLPSADIQVVRGAVHRHATPREEAASDHFPVWLDVIVDP